MNPLPPSPRRLTAQERGAFAYRDGMDHFRQLVNGTVAGFVRDGFTDEQAQAIVAHGFGWEPARNDEDEEGTGGTS